MAAIMCFYGVKYTTCKVWVVSEAADLLASSNGSKYGILQMPIKIVC